MICERERMGWQKASSYTRRALAEAAISRFKRVIGDALHSRTGTVNLGGLGGGGRDR